MKKTLFILLLAAAPTAIHAASMKGQTAVLGSNPASTFGDQRAGQPPSADAQKAQKEKDDFFKNMNFEGSEPPSYVPRGAYDPPSGNGVVRPGGWRGPYDPPTANGVVRPGG